MKNIARDLLSKALVVLAEQGIITQELATFDINIQDTRNKEHGDCASNIALILAKKNNLSAVVLATKICANLPKHEAVSKVVIAKPGFINFYQNQQFVVQKIAHALSDDHLGVTKDKQANIVVIDMSGPNLAKEMHVGHLRSTIIGDCIAKVLEFLGHKVIRQNHVGDWGTQFGMLLAYLKKNDVDADTELQDLESFYRAAKLEFDSSAEFANHAREMVVKLQSADNECLTLWRKFNDISLRHCQSVYDALGVNLSPCDVKGESSYNDDLPKVIDDLSKQNLLSVSKGANCVFLPEFTNSDGEILPLIVQKSDGGYLYATTDLAALRYRVNQLKAKRILYFVDMRQSLHFQMVFALARKAQFVPADVELSFMGFGTLNDANGRPFKTRDGGTVRLIDLLSEAQNRAYQLMRDKNPHLDDKTLEQSAKIMGIGAIKYADLSKNRTSDYNFSFEQMLRFDGNTAPYLMYAYTRVVSLLKKANLDISSKIHSAIYLNDDYELDLANQLIKFDEILHKVAVQGTPHILCAYLYELAGLFSSFYENCAILSLNDDEIKNSRLQLAVVTARTIKCGLNLLGIQTLERM